MRVKQRDDAGATKQEIPPGILYTMHVPPATADVAQVFRTYRQQRSIALRDELTYTFMPLVHRIAARYRSFGVPMEDLHQIGYVGLMTAIAQYDPERGVPFEAYARPFISGEIRHHFRSQGTAVRRPRWIYELDYRIRRKVDELTQRLGRLPTLSEIANAVNVSDDGVLEVLRAREAVRAVSLDDTGGNGGEEPSVRREAIVHKYYQTLQLPIEDRIRVAEAVERLSVLQRKVIYYLFYMDLTQTEAAKKLRISQRHVSRLMYAAVGRLREMLKADFDISPSRSKKRKGPGRAPGSFGPP